MLLELEDVCQTYQGLTGSVDALKAASLTIDSAEFVAIQGPSGCGKTTLLMVAGSLLEPNTGQVRVDGTEPYALSREERARFRAQTTGFVFQQFHLIPYLNVRDNVLAPSVASTRADARRRADELIEKYGLTSRADHVPAHLSSGERQRCALARALLNGPRLLLADEPTGNLDEDNAEIVLQSLQAFAQEGGAVLLVTHDPRAAHAAHRVVQMQDGCLASTPVGTPGT